MQAPGSSLVEGGVPVQAPGSSLVGEGARVLAPGSSLVVAALCRAGDLGGSQRGQGSHVKGLAAREWVGGGWGLAAKHVRCGVLRFSALGAMKHTCRDVPV